MKSCYISIRGTRWKLVLGRPPQNKCDGLCCYDIKTIYIRSTCKDPVATCVHEILHSCFPDLDEFAVCQAEEAIVKALRLIGNP